MTITIKSVEFVKSSAQVDDCPDVSFPEFAFIGRSNVGKSSLINAITGRKKLAKTSNTPGKTQLINHFLVNESWHLVDLPGYGYAKVSKSSREKFSDLIMKYFEFRTQLTCAFVLVDVTIPPQKIDLEFIEYLGTHSKPFAIIFTKADRLSKNKVQKNIATFNKEMKKNWESLPLYFISSSVEKKGIEEILQFISEIKK